jgi:hypothetical protein
VTRDWAPGYAARHLARLEFGTQSAAPVPYISMAVVMFKITHNTVQHFSLAEVLLMVAINQMQANRKVRS